MSSLFDNADRPSLAARLAPALSALAVKGVRVGASSWKYPGWMGSIYTQGRYESRRKFSKKKFDPSDYTGTSVSLPSPRPRSTVTRSMRP